MNADTMILRAETESAFDGLSGFDVIETYLTPNGNAVVLGYDNASDQFQSRLVRFFDAESVIDAGSCQENHHTISQWVVDAEVVDVRVYASEAALCGGEGCAVLEVIEG